MDAAPASLPSPSWKTWSAFAACVLIWGSTFLAISIGNDTVPPVWAATLRLTLAAVILGLLMAILRQGIPRGPALKAAILYGLFQFGGNFPLLYWGETEVPSGLAAIIFATIPLTTAFMARWFGLEKLTRAKVGGALIALFGVVIIFSGEVARRAAVIPMIAILAATWVACIGSLFLKRGPRQPAIAVNAVGCVVGAAACLLISMVMGESRNLPTMAAAVIPILYLAVAGSVGAFVLFAWLVNHWEVTRISFIAVLLPIVALTLGTLLRGERLTVAGMVGSIVVLAGVAVGQQLLRRPTAKPGAAKGDSR